MHDPYDIETEAQAEYIIKLMGGALVFGTCAALTIAMFIFFALAFDIPWGLR